MLPLPREYPLEKLPSPPRDPPEEFIKDLADSLLSPLNLQLLQAIYTCLLTFDIPSKPMAGGRILRDTPSLSPTREASSVRVIDAVILRQEVNDDVFREIDDYPVTQNSS
ncbi:hypothetical protein LIER_43527 [Lithospermum erythrorhizon]|uniref:Uncharacterized protein n=1 Tax=Lithospermum erythrorhizon TaxID=34254 RepID=A0AAV3QC95_LITER